MLKLKQEVHNLKHYLKMKTNDVINCINKTLDAEREAKGLPKMLGHFVFCIDWKKGMGPIKEFQARVDFVNMKYGTTHPVIRYNHVENCPNELQFCNDFVDNNPLVISTDRDYAKLNDHNWSSIRVNEGLFWTRKNELVLNNYPHDNFLHIQEDSFSNMSSLTITNLPELRVILCEDTSFCTTTSFNISSII